MASQNLTRPAVPKRAAPRFGDGAAAEPGTPAVDGAAAEPGTPAADGAPAPSAAPVPKVPAPDRSKRRKYPLHAAPKAPEPVAVDEGDSETEPDVIPARRVRGPPKVRAPSTIASDTFEGDSEESSDDEGSPKDKRRCSHGHARRTARSNGRRRSAAGAGEAKRRKAGGRERK
jgi:hypothetical protein